MKAVFVDSSYWIAIINPKDQWHDAAKRAKKKVGSVRLATTEEVLMEVLTGLSKYGEAIRKNIAAAVRAIIENPNVKVIPQTRDSFARGLNRYENRLDKEYSMQDCISFNTMEDEGITTALTSDHHFEQEGFVVLMPTKIT